MIPPQVFVGSRPSRRKFVPVRPGPLANVGYGAGNCKPHGGLWTSTYHPVLGSAWLRWCASERFDWPPRVKRNVK